MDGMNDPNDEKHRATGRTSGLAIETLSRASLSPDTWVTFTDHYKPRRNANYTRMLKVLAERLGFEYRFRFVIGQTQVMFPLKEMKQRVKSKGSKAHED